MEMVIILPVLLVLLLGIIEIGFYLVKMEIVARSVSTIANAIQANPNDPNLQSLAEDSGAGVIRYASDGNYICAQSYASANAANSGCNDGQWNTGLPAGVTQGTPYYVALKAVSPFMAITPLANFLNGFSLNTITQAIVIEVGPLTGTLHTTFYQENSIQGQLSYTCPLSPIGTKELITSCAQIINYGNYSCTGAINSTGDTCNTNCADATSLDVGNSQPNPYWVLSVNCAWIQ